MISIATIILLGLSFILLGLFKIARKKKHKFILEDNRGGMQLSDWIILIRPKQWVKNLLVFAAIAFSKHLFDLSMLVRVTITFMAFCGLASSIYILNDLLDREEDRNHPWKNSRPIAAGKIEVKSALVGSAILLIISFLVSWILGFHLLLLFVFYFLLQMIYSVFGLKHVVLLDVIVIACGFVIRAIAGGIVINAMISNWLLLCTFLLALFLGLCKRRQEIILLEDQAELHRKVLTEYSPSFIDSLLAVVTGATVVSYALYTVSPEVVAKLGTNKLIYTFPFVIYGIFRYLYLLHRKSAGDNPTQVLFTDHPLQLDILMWIVTCVVLIYFKI